MEQLNLTPKQLEAIGFQKKEFGNINRYAIGFINGIFYYNPFDSKYTWYQRVEINGGYNYVYLNISSIDDLFKLLTFFQITFNYIKL